MPKEWWNMLDLFLQYQVIKDVILLIVYIVIVIAAIVVTIIRWH